MLKRVETICFYLKLERKSDLLDEILDLSQKDTGKYLIFDSTLLD